MLQTHCSVLVTMLFIGDDDDDDVDDGDASPGNNKLWSVSETEEKPLSYKLAPVT